MQLEILNIIKFLAFMLVIAFIYGKCHIVLRLTTWKVYWVMMLCFSIITYSQFFTLTEKADSFRTQTLMLKQNSQVSNNRQLAIYLTENTPEVRLRSETSLELELEKQQLKSRNLANTIKLEQGTN